jgi:hypothetical protein
MPKKKREPLGQLSRSSGCIYLTQYISFAVRGKTPHPVFCKNFKIFSEKVLTQVASARRQGDL